MIAILGSGFGLYGYLPALVDGCKERIVLPERCRSHFNERSELQRFASDVKWEQNEAEVLDCVSGVVLALQPIKQCEWVPQCLARSNIERLLLEKPLAHSPEVAITLFEDLLRSRKVFRIGYTFRYTEWGKQLLNILASQREGGLLTIRWSFMAHHFRHNLQNWKRFNSAGGGAIRFYGIHLIALLSEIGYRNVSLSQASGTSPEEVEKWVAIFEGPGLPECEVIVDTKSNVSEFKIELASNSTAVLTTTVFANLSDPFESQNKVYELDQIDQRVPILSQLCRSLWEDGTKEYEWYNATNWLWLTIENKTQFWLLRTALSI
jgi:predicted dehydrogenase